MKIAFFEHERWAEGDFLSHIREGMKEFEKKFGNAELIFIEGPLKLEHYKKINDCGQIVVSVNCKINEEVLKNLPNLKAVSTISTGFDHINLDDCKKRNIPVSYVPSYGENSVAELAFGLLNSISRGIAKDSEYTRSNGRFEHSGTVGFDLAGKTIGVLGTGRIGRFAIKIANGYGMNVVAYDAFPNPKLLDELKFKYVDLDTLFRTSDIITVHVPLLKETKHMINKDAIKKMKHGIVLINTSRGPVINNEALLEGLESGIINSAGLDVIDNEEMLKNEDNDEVKLIRKIIAMKNVFMTPHNGFNTAEAIKRRMDVIVQNLMAAQSNSPINIAKPFP